MRSAQYISSLSLRLLLELLGLSFLGNASLMRFALIMMVNNFQPKVTIARRERRANVMQRLAPLATVNAEHQILHRVILQPNILLQPNAAKPRATLARRKFLS